MGKSAGRGLPISPFRRIVTDLMSFSQKVPSVTADRRFDLAELIAARQRCNPRPTWSAIFAKAYGMLGRDYPELRRNYLKFPWPYLYEHPHSIATINIERQLPGESIVLYCLIRSPENRTLAEIDEKIRYHKETPVEQLRSYQRTVAVSRIPWPLRHWFWWASLNIFGRRRCHNFGTFGLTSVASLGAGLQRLIPLLTTTLHHSLFDDQGRLEMRLSWDHRVMDGATVARVLVDFESTLNREILREITSGLAIAG